MRCGLSSRTEKSLLTCVGGTNRIRDMELTIEQFKKWGKQGGAKRKRNMTAKQRRASARRAARARWQKKGNKS